MILLGVVRTTRFAFSNFWRNLWLSLITVFVMVLTIFSMTLVAGLNILGQQVIDAIQQKVDVTILFYPDVSDEIIFSAHEELNEMDEVAQVVYISQESALQQFKENHADDPDILRALEELDTNILPASLVIRANDIDEYPRIVDRFQSSEYFQYVDRTDFSDSKQIIETIDRIISRLYTVGVGVSTIFIVIAIIVMFNTIRVTIYSHQEEVGIMKLVGATNWFIRAPFVIESILIGTMSATVTIGLFYLLLYVTDPMLTAFFTGYEFSLFVYFRAHAAQFIALELAVAVVLSVVSSMIAITRYLKV